jgi:hypothetical protein
MRVFIKSSVQRLGFWFWALALLVLPNCVDFHAGLVLPPNLNPGSLPRTSTIFCDIEKPLGRHCASETEKITGVRFAAAAVALNAGLPGGNIGLDDSPDALARCNGEPEAATFQGQFPEGYSVCLNCSDVIGTAPYPDVNAACVAQCEDFFGTILDDGLVIPDNPPDPSVRAFCLSHARASTNFPLNDCFADACSPAGTLRQDFVDPRRNPEPVVWRDLIGVAASGGTLTRTEPFTGIFDAGAASSQLIDHGDGFVEFNATETNTTRLCGLSSGGLADPDPRDVDIGYAIGLRNVNNSGRISIIENGRLVQSFGAYNAGDRFRVRVKDNFNGTATISYSRVAEPCAPGRPCNETVLYTSATPGQYPFRVDSSFIQFGATLTDVRLVRIR